MGSVKGQRSMSRKDNPPSKDSISVPQRIAQDPEKLELWNLMVADFKDRDIFSSTYMILLNELVETVTLLEECREDVEVNGKTLPKYNRDGDEVGVTSNPCFDQMCKLQSALLKILEKAGMTPRDIGFLLRTDSVSPDEVVQVVQDNNQPKIVYFR